LEGEIEVAGNALLSRDGMGIWETNEIAIKASTNARVLFMEIPMSV